MTSVAAVSRFWTRTFLAALVTSIAIGLSGCGQSSKTVDEYLQDAQAHRLSGNLSAAVLDLKNALQRNPDNSAARYMLGEIYLDIGDGASAEKELTRAKDLGMGAQSMSLPLARAWLLQRQYKKVLDDLPMPASGDTQKQVVLSLHGQALLGLGDFDQAEAAFKQAQAISADSVDAIIGLARVAMARGKLDAAQSLQAQAEELSPHGIEGLSLKADLAFLKKDYKAASEVYGELVKLRPQNLVFQLGRSWAQVGANQLDDAAKSLDAILRVTPNSVPANYLLGVVYYGKEKYDDANESLERVLNQDSSYAPALLLAGASNYVLKHYEQAANYLSRLVSMAPRLEPALKLLAMTQMQLGQKDAAVATLKPLMVAPDKIEDEQTLRLVAAAALQSGDLRSGKNYIEKAVERAPDDSDLRAQLGLARIDLGDVEQGLADLKAAAEQAPGVGNEDAVLAYNLIKAGKFEDAMNVARQLQTAHPDQSVGYVLEGMVHDRQGKKEAAVASFSKALEVNPAATDAAHNLAAIQERDKDMDAAQATLENFLKVNPDNIHILGEAIQLEARMGNADKVESHLKHIVEIRPDAAEPRVYLGRLYLAQGKAAQTASLLEEVLQDNQDNKDLLEVLGQAQLQTGQSGKALNTFTQWTKIANSSAAAHYWLASARRETGDLSGARDEVNRSLSIEPNDPSAQLLKGDLSARLGNKAGLQAALKSLSGNAAVTASAPYKDLQASLALLTGDTAGAIRINEELNAQAPSSERTSKLALLEVRNGDAASATRRLEDWLKDHPADHNVQVQLSGLYSDQGNYAAAERLLASLVGEDPNFWAGQNDLAWALYKQDKMNDARQHAEVAARLAPDNPLVLDTYGTILLASGNAEKAIVYLERAVQAAPRLTSSQLSLAKSYVAVDRVEDAKRVLGRLIRDNGTSPERDEAQALLTELQKQEQE